MSTSSGPRTPREISDDLTDTVLDYDPTAAEVLGLRPGSDAVPDYSPERHQQLVDDLSGLRVELDAATTDGTRPLPPEEQRAARLLRERIDTFRATPLNSELNNLFSPPQKLRTMLILAPRDTPEDWAVLGRRLAHIDESVAGYRASLGAALRQGSGAAPRQVETLIAQLRDSDGWFRGLADAAPAGVHAEVSAAAGSAADAMRGLSTYLADEYLPLVQEKPDGVGADAYLVGARYFNGADLDLAEAYAYGWEEFHRLSAELATLAGEILPGSAPRAAMDHLKLHGEAVEGEENIRVWLQEFMDRAIDDFDGTHFDLADRVKRVESMIAPPGGAAAAHYTPPSHDFSRPGRTWLPTLGETRFPTWDIVSTWYHEGVPGHHLQLAQWRHVADTLSTFQVTVGQVSACVEGWALYAERLADELGFLTDPAHRLGYLSEQTLRAARVIIDIGMHLRLRIPAGAGFHDGEIWTPELATEFLLTHTGMQPGAYTDSEITRYLGIPGQAISYKLGERAWLAGREAARTAQGDAFDLKTWHMKALSLGSLGLDDLADELAAL
ncbi:DUF885 domain-containing protein [Streptomyces spiramenti]|uniref:DUF885 domain-containing protein n=1 Tax=Streptomyces spiramenti TaxID=2720606 RepID=A0ABX1ATK2_9ACTN|nr:DUF885 domain-containing protein [Streptomyces spiramenti]NJP67602.1 DUF885 domain-containing protein [Streptomyces spiramenti]